MTHTKGSCTSRRLATETYGIPQQGPYYQIDRPRAFFKLPFCHQRALHADEMHYSAMQKFYNKLLEIDSYFGPEDFKVKLFGDKMASTYEYQPIVRHPDRDNDEEEEVTDKSSTKAVKGLLPTSLHQGQADAF